MLFALPKGTSGSLAIRHSDRQAVLGPVRVLPNAPSLQNKQCSASVGLRGIPCPCDQFCYVSTHAVFLRNRIRVLEFYKLLYQKDLSNDQEVACKVLFSFCRKLGYAL